MEGLVNQVKMTMFLLSLPLTDYREDGEGGVEPIIRPVTKKAWPSFIFLVPRVGERDVGPGMEDPDCV